MTSRGRRRLAVVLGMAVGSGIGVALLGGIALLSARGAIDRGARAAQAALVAARSGRLLETQQQLRISEQGFAAGRRRLDLWWARPAALIPVERQNLRAAQAVTASALDLIGKAEPALEKLARTQLRISAGQVPLAQLVAIEATTANGYDSVVASKALLDKARSPLLLPAIASPLQGMRTKLEQLSTTLGDALDAERLVEVMLGGPGATTATPCRYFVAFTTPSELRGATGLMANYGEVTATDGRVALIRFGRMEDLAGHAPATPTGAGWDPQFTAAYGPILTGALWQNVTMSPDFPTAARAIEDLYPRSGGDAVNGVVAIDPEGLSALLSIEGPVAVPGWPGQITSGNIAQILEHDQYNQFPGTNQRVAFLANLTTQVVDGLDHPHRTGLFQVARIMGAALRGKHILLASSQPEEQATLVHLGAAGALPPPRGDVLGVFSVNASTNKADWYLRRQITYRVDVGREGLDGTITVTLHNEAPAGGQAAAVLQGTPGIASPGHNREILSILTPWDFAGASADGKPVTVDEAPFGGMRLFSLLIDIPPGSVDVVQFHVTGPRPVVRYQLDFVAQPLAHPDSLQLEIAIADGTRLTRSLTVQSDLRLG